MSKYINVHDLRPAAPAIAHVIWQSEGEDTRVPHKDTTAAKEELAALIALKTAAESLNVVVEGVRNERWASEGRRLKDTPEWCAFYCALAALKRTEKPQR